MTQPEKFNLDSLPESYRVISYTGDAIEVSSDKQQDYAIILVSGEEDNGQVWFLYTEDGQKDNLYYNFKKRLKDRKLNIIKEGITESATIKRIYEIRGADDTQRATKTDSNAIAFFELMLTEALKGNISDIHVESRAFGGQIKMRKHGEMMKWRDNMTSTDTFNLCSVIYNVLAENKQVNFDAQEFQPAAVPYKVGNEQVKLRYQSLPVYPDGFDVVLRILPIGRDEEFTPLDKLGYTPQQVRDLLEASSKPLGALIIAGVTGSGKSTTLKNLIMFINSSTEFKNKIFTIEDPPEYRIPHVSQIPVVRPKDTENLPPNYSAFEKPITACMRADPDIIMIGEVRDSQTGVLTKKAIQSGHQVLTTIHAPSGIGIIERLLDFDISRSVLASPDFLTALVYQRLLPTLCPHCKVKFKDVMSNSPDVRDVEMARRLTNLNIDLNKYTIYVRNPSGCAHCDEMGINGRQVCAEIIRIDLDIMDKILKGDNVGLIKSWREKSDGKIDSLNMSGKTSMEHAVQKMLTGIISPFDVESNFASLTQLYMDKPKRATNEKLEDTLDSIIEQPERDMWAELG